MLTAFWQGVGSKLADRWSSTAVGSLVFWALGLGALAWRFGFGAAVTTVSTWISARPALVQGALVVGTLVVVAGSASLVARVTLPVTQVLEGYGWPFWLRWPLVRWTAWRVRRAEERFQRAEALKEDESLSGVARRRSVDRTARLELWLRRFPTEADLQEPARLMPTRLGNVLRAAETRPTDKYGLDAVICWPRLWLCMPDTARQELTAARGALDTAIGACCWAALFVVWTPWQPVALPAAVVFAVVAYRLWAVPRAAAYGELVEAAFDLHRGELYTALRWPRPENPAQEHGAGKAVTSYLWRGSDAEKPVFEAPSP